MTSKLQCTAHETSSRRRAALASADVEPVHSTTGWVETFYRDLGDARIVRVSAEAKRFAQSARPNDAPIAVLVSEGAMLVTARHAARGVEVCAGQLAVLGAEARARIRLESRAVFYVLPYAARSRPHSIAVDAARSGIARIALACCEAMWREAGSLDGAARTFAFEHLTELIQRAVADERTVRAAEQPSATLEQIRRYVLGKLGDPGLSPRQVADGLHMSLRTLHMRFMSEGTTFGDWVREQRLLGCDDELRSRTSAHRQISEICLAWGFEDLSHFGRLYKARFGATPRARRAAALAHYGLKPQQRGVGGGGRVRRRRRMAALTELLLAARTGGPPIGRLPAEALPQSLDEAYEIASALIAGLGRAVVGYKIGGTAPKLLALFNLTEPFMGRILADTVHASGAVIGTGGRTFDAEAEFAFVLGRDLLQGAESRESLIAAVETCRPAIELNRPSYLEPFAMGAYALIADNGVNAGVVLGAPIDAWPNIDLAHASARVYLNGELKGFAEGSEVFGNPLSTLQWLANARARAGEPLRAGQIILSGSLGPLVYAGRGDRLEADFGPLGRVCAEFTS